MVPGQNQTGATITYAYATDRGLKRADNQDAYGKFPAADLALTQAKGQLFIVADGMGGLAAGAEASQTAVQIIQETYFADPERNIPESLKHAFETANAAICQHAQTTPGQELMGTTCTALVLTEKFAYIAHIGDSRAYRITKHEIIPLTQDHTFLAEMQRRKILSTTEAQAYSERSTLYRALGIAAMPEIDVLPDITYQPGDWFLLHTDGLNRITPAEIQTIVHNNSVQAACKQLIRLANTRGGEDNCTVIIIQIKSAPRRSPHLNLKKKWASIGWYKWLISVISLMAGLYITYYLIQNLGSGSIFPRLRELPAPHQIGSVPNDSLPHPLSDANLFHQQLQQADAALKNGDLDSANMLYRELLKLDPMNIRAINGMNQLISQYKIRADAFRSKNKFAQAYVFYRKLTELLPQDEKLKKLLEFCEYQRQQIQTPRTPMTVATATVTESDTIRAGPRVTEPKPDSSPCDTVTVIKRADWNVAGLTPNDYTFKSDTLCIHRTPVPKLIWYPRDFRDFDFEVRLQFDPPALSDEGGIMLGLPAHYLLLAVDASGRVSFQKVTGAESEILFAIANAEAAADSPSKKLKVRCLGPWMMLYYAEKLVWVWNAEKLITGQPGLFAAPAVGVEFSQLRITPLISHKLK
jgi:serine/threonine protein phosphatase PrpC